MTTLRQSLYVLPPEQEGMFLAALAGPQWPTLHTPCAMASAPPPTGDLQVVDPHCLAGKSEHGVSVF